MSEDNTETADELLAAIKTAAGLADKLDRELIAEIEQRIHAEASAMLAWRRVEELEARVRELEVLLAPPDGDYGAKVEVRVGGLGRRWMCVALATRALLHADPRAALRDFEGKAVSATRDAVERWGRDALIMPRVSTAAGTSAGNNPPGDETTPGAGTEE